MTLLIRRVLPSQRDAVRADLTAMNSSISTSGPIQFGATGKAVEALQRHLKASGVYSGPISGSFDAATDAALKAFQTAKDLAPTGRVNKATFLALKEINLLVKAGFATSARIGQRGRDVAAAEKMMARLGFLSGDKADGVYDKATQAAVLRYRRSDKQLGDKGVLTANFYSELKAANALWNHAAYRRREVGDTAASTAHKKLDDTTAKKAASTNGIGPQSTGAVVKNVERHLNAAGFNLGAASESWGPRTTAALLEFQRRQGLPQTGLVDSATWSKLRGALFAAAGSTSPAQALGEKGGAVLQTEEMLKALGKNTGKVDGLYTEKTVAAVKAFQKRHKLAVTGRVNSATLKAIKQAISASFNLGAGSTWKPDVPPSQFQKGYDLSHWQSTALFHDLLNKPSTRFMGIKATDGTSFVDPTFKSRWAELGKRLQPGRFDMRLAYHFLQPGNGAAQANHFLKTLGISGPLKPGTRLALDWEASALSSPQTLRDAAKRIHDVTGTWPLVYCSSSRASQARNVVPRCPLWVAHWPPSPEDYKNPLVQTDGVSLDKDIFAGSEKLLRRWAGWPV